MSDTLPILIVDDQPKLRLVIELMTRLGFPRWRAWPTAPRR